MNESASPVPMTARHRVETFDCGRPELNEWLARRALRNHLANYTSVQVIADTGQKVIGFYGLSASSVFADSMPRAIRGGQAPDPVPVLLIGRFAVDLSQQGEGLGTRLFRHALRRCERASRIVGARAVVVNAIDDNAARFYVRHGFRAADEPLTLFQSMERVRGSL